MNTMRTGSSPTIGALVLCLLSLSTTLSFPAVVVTGFSLPLRPCHQNHRFELYGKVRYATAEETSEEPGNEEVSGAATTTSTIVPPEITTKALIQLYPALVEHKTKYGNPNIPLGSVEGRQCNLIRRMQIQNKLTAEEITHLKEMGFIFHSLEDVYFEVDFDEMVPRLLQAKQDNNNTLDIPKKYAPDPELGAYVTGIRRLGKDRVDPKHVVVLDEMDFVWVSSRKCGSKFMEQYRSIQKRLLLADESEEKNLEEVVFGDPEVIKFVRAQKEAHKRGTLSETRIEYMTRLLGEEWWNK